MPRRSLILLALLVPAAALSAAAATSVVVEAGSSACLGPLDQPSTFRCAVEHVVTATALGCAEGGPGRVCSVRYAGRAAGESEVSGNTIVRIFRDDGVRESVMCSIGGPTLKQGTCQGAVTLAFALAPEACVGTRVVSTVGGGRSQVGDVAVATSVAWAQAESAVRVCGSTVE